MTPRISSCEAKENPDVILKVRESQIQQLFRQTWGGSAGIIAAISTNCVIFWHVYPHWKLLSWAGGLILLLIARGVLTYCYQKKAPTGPAIFRWAKVHVSATIVIALMWGVPSVLLWPSNSPLHQMVWTISVAAITAAAVAMYFTWKPIYYAYLILAVVPISFRLLLEGGLFYTVLGIQGFLFGAVLSHIGNTLNAANVNAFKASIRNKTLSSVLSVEKAKTEELNHQLKKEVEERKESQEKLRCRNQELGRLNEQQASTKRALVITNAELKLALENVKQLSGMLPICASCKKIRNDQGYWEQIEQYIHDHSEAEFTHSICPGCAAELYQGIGALAKQ